MKLIGELFGNPLAKAERAKETQSSHGSISHPKKRNGRDIFFAVFISLNFLYGLVLLGQGCYSLYYGRQAQFWPTTEGRLSECRLQKSNVRGGTSWEVEVHYTYHVRGRNFEGSRVAFAYRRTVGHEDHQAIYDKLQHPSTVEVRYAPANPSRSVLLAGMDRFVFSQIKFAALWLLLVTGFVVLFFIFKPSRPSGF